MSGTLFLVQLQQEGRLQRGDEVMVDGKPGTVSFIVSPTEIDVDLAGGYRSRISGLQLSGATLTTRQS